MATDYQGADALKPPVSVVPLPQVKFRWWGLAEQRLCWRLTWRGCVLLCFILVLGIFGFCRAVHPFLAVTDKVETEYVVVEGWVPNYALEASIQEFRSGPYKKLFTIGAKSLNGVEVEEGDNKADWAYARLKGLGMKPDLMVSIPSSAVYRDRTYHSASALRDWFQTNHVPVTTLNVVTLGAHARRSRMLFERAFQGQVRIGIVSVPDREYDPQRWWLYSEGVKTVFNECLSCFYTKLFFRPSALPAKD